MKLTRAFGVTVAIALTMAGFAVSEASADSKQSSRSLPNFGDFVAAHGTSAIRQVNPGLTAADIESLSNDPTARVNSFGKILFIENKIDSGTVLPSTIAANVTGIPLENFLSLNSRPDSNRTIFLDFDGHTVPAGTIWDYARPTGFGGSPLVAGDYPAFSMDNSPAFNNTEKQAIINAWAAVAEDYAIFDVNVTTQDPGQAAIERTGVADAAFGTRALITGGNSEFNPNRCGCGGIAYTGVFDESIESPFGSTYGISHEEWQPAFVFVEPTQVSTWTAAQAGKFISDIASHEVGHNLSLLHDGSFQDSNRDRQFVDNNHDGIDDITGDIWTEYFYGDRDKKNWAPIMGAGYVNGVVQWSNGDYGTAANPATNTEDDFAGIAANGLNRLPDEVYNSRATAALIGTVATDGIINTRADVDWYKAIVTNGTLGVYSYAPTPNTNLDTKLTLMDGAGVTLFSTDAPSTATDNTMPVAGMDGVLNANLPNGTYYLKIEGVGRTGSYSDYGSVGAYSIKTRTPSVASISNTGTPRISGTTRRGRTLTASYGSWSTGTTFTKQWLRDGVAIPGATKKTYVLTRADVGHKISIRLVASKAGYRTSIKVSAKTARIKN